MESWFGNELPLAIPQRLKMKPVAALEARRRPLHFPVPTRLHLHPEG
jgi:hypothetical protein